MPTPSTATPRSIPTRTYRVTLHPGDAVYMSLTVYGGPDDGRYSTRIVGSVNSHDARRDADGAIHIVISPEEPGEPGVDWIRLEPDAVAAITRDYLEDPQRGRRATLAHRIGGPSRDVPPGRRRPGAAFPRRGDLGARAGQHRADPPGHAERHRPPLPGAHGHLRVGRRRRRVRHGRLRAGGRRGSRHPGPLARVRLLEHVPVEPRCSTPTTTTTSP